MELKKQEGTKEARNDKNKRMKKEIETHRSMQDIKK